ncbi:hypothetical protein LIER_07349 [Lithospermum erythrorhizon]|uniref:SAP domain-containing protein n=1 Tax=Lithospermum erythrorhizon TaxID=34254 RepID=A0AAV3P9S0_LITER
MSKAEGKRPIIQISSDEELNFSSSTSSEDDYTDDEIDSMESYGDKDDDINDLDDASICTRISQRIRDGDDLQGLSLKDYKAYLRVNGLRLSGTKEECIERIKEHWRINNGGGERLYPRSSFTIDCTGDVCKGDVVLFSQKVYTDFNRMKRSGNVSGKRTIAGRVVKESYGAAKQQHTFTVEVLWSKGLKTLPSLYPLLVKGRNLYRLKTFRQCWKNEGERYLVLAEKHNRGAAARSIRAMRKREGARRTEAKTSRKTGKGKHQKGNNLSKQSQQKQRSDVVKGKGVARKKRSYDHHDKFLPSRQLNLENATMTSHKRQRLVHTNPIPESLFQYNPGPQPRRPNDLPPRYSHSTYLPNLSYDPAYFGMPVEHQQLAHASYPHPNLLNFASDGRSRNRYHLRR